MNYRRQDTQWAARQLQRALVARFGRAQVFFDDESLRGGDRYPDTIRAAISAADLLLVIIGPNWLTLRGADEDGRALWREGDWVRYEIAQGLRRGISVVPVLVDGTKLPDATDLPPDISDLSTMQRMELRSRTPEPDIDAVLDLVVERVPTLRRSRPRRFLPAAAALGLLAAVLAGIATWLPWPPVGPDGGSPPPSISTSTSPSPAPGSGRSTGPTGSGRPPPATAPSVPTPLGLQPVTAGADNLAPGQTATLAGSDYLDAVKIACEYDQPMTVQFRLGGSFTRLTGLFGVIDVSEVDAPAQLTVRADDRSVWSKTTAASREPIRAEIDVRGVESLGLTLVCTSTSNALGVLAEALLSR